MTHAEALARAREVDPKAENVAGAPDVLLVANEHVEAVLALFPGALRDDNDPPTAWTRVVLPA